MGMRAGVSDVLTARELRAQGVQADRLVGTEFVRPARGVYLPRSADLSSPDVRIAVVAANVPDGFFIGGWAAARLHERMADRSRSLTVFDGCLLEMDAVREKQAVLVCAGRERRLRRTAGVRLIRSDLAPHEGVEVEGVAVTSPLRAAFDLGRLWPLTSAVVAIDRLRALGLVSATDLAELLGERSGWRGVDRARRALELSDAGAESPRETMVRLLWKAARLPRPLCNPVLRGPAGEFLGRVDLLDDDAGLVAEYDGAHHAGAARRHDDAVRQERLEGAGLVVVRVNEPDIGSLQGRRALQDRLRRARARALRWARPRMWQTMPR